MIYTKFNSLPCREGQLSQLSGASGPWSVGKCLGRSRSGEHYEATTECLRPIMCTYGLKIYGLVQFYNVFGEVSSNQHISRSIQLTIYFLYSLT